MKLWIKDVIWCYEAFKFLRKARKLNVDVQADLKMTKREEETLHADDAS